MGFFKDLLKPKNFLRTTVNQFDPIGRTLRDSTGNQNLGLNPIKDVKGWTSGPKNNPTDGVGDGYGWDPSLYFGDPNDPNSGWLTKPFDVEEFYKYQDPGYAFELQQGTQALQNANSAGSGAFTGAALKDLLGYSQNFARTGYNDAFNRYQVQQGNIFGRLRDIATLGQNAAAGVGTNGTALAGNAGQLTSNAGAAAGAGIVGAGNAVNNGLTNYWLMRNFMQQPRAVATGPGGGL